MRTLWFAALSSFETHNQNALSQGDFNKDEGALNEWEVDSFTCCCTIWTSWFFSGLLESCVLQDSIVSYLISAGSDREAKDQFGYTALHVAGMLHFDIRFMIRVVMITSSSTWSLTYCPTPAYLRRWSGLENISWRECRASRRGMVWSVLFWMDSSSFVWEAWCPWRSFRTR